MTVVRASAPDFEIQEIAVGKSVERNLIHHLESARFKTPYFPASQCCGVCQAVQRTHPYAVDAH